MGAQSNSQSSFGNLISCNYFRLSRSMTHGRNLRSYSSALRDFPSNCPTQQNKHENKIKKLKLLLSISLLIDGSKHILFYRLNYFFPQHLLKSNSTPYGKNSDFFQMLKALCFHGPTQQSAKITQLFAKNTQLSASLNFSAKNTQFLA